MDDGGGPITIGFMIYFCFIILDSMMFGFGAAIQSISESILEKHEEETKKASQIRYWKDNPENLIHTIQIVSNLLSLLTGSLMVHTVSIRWTDTLAGTSIANYLSLQALQILMIFVGVLLFLLVLYPLGIHIPKLLGKKNPQKWCFGLVNIISAIVTISSPLTKLVMALVCLIRKLLRIQPENFQEDVTEEEIISIINEGQEQGMLEAAEAEMINNIFEFGDKEAQDIMTHRKNIVAVDGMQQLSKAMDFMLNASNSRFPVYEGNVDNITGILHLKDAMKYLTLGNYDAWLLKDIPDLIREAIFIPETRKINLLFKSMQSQKQQMVMVADEYGQTAGLVALEDILEEIVGNIQDEYDNEENMIEKIDENTYLIYGLTPLEDVEEALETAFDLEEDIGTLNGFLISKLEKIPSENEHSIIQVSDYTFEILSVAKNTIQKVRAIKSAVDNIGRKTDAEEK